MNDSERMSELILKAYAKCEQNGHRMDWRRYSNQRADAECISCGNYVYIEIDKWYVDTVGKAIFYKCKEKGGI